jgi:G3E family GTPase
MNNGCICCTVRGDLVVALGTLAKKREAGELDFDHVVIETTGLANPGPVAQTFFIEETVAMHYLVDAVITVVDAKHAMHQLDTYEEAQRQIGFADKILLSKTDLADPSELAALRARIKRINPRAPMANSDFGNVAIADVLDIRGFNLNDKIDIDPDFIVDESDGEPHAHDHAHHAAHHAEQAHHHQCDENCAHDHHHAHHSDNIAAFAFKSERPFNTEKLDEFLGSIVQVFGPRMLRYKGVLWMDGADRKVVFQGVHQVMGSDIAGKWGENETRSSKLVFIGQNLPKETFILGLEQCLV